MNGPFKGLKAMAAAVDKSMNGDGPLKLKINRNSKLNTSMQSGMNGMSDIVSNVASQEGNIMNSSQLLTGKRKIKVRASRAVGKSM